MPDSSVDLSGKRALVTGGSRGIGRAICSALARGGAEVAVNYKSDAAAAGEVVKEITANGGRAWAVQADVSVGSDVRRMFAEVARRFGNRLDFLVNNAGGLQRSAIASMPEGVWDHIMAVNAKSVFLCTQAALPLLPDKEGRIVNVTSIAARNGGAFDSTHYAAAKGAVSTFTRGSAKALAPRGITVNGIAPGVIYTDFHKLGTPEAALREMLGRIPLGRLGDAADCAEAVVLLCSPGGAYITGEIIEINGGLLMD